MDKRLEIAQKDLDNIRTREHKLATEKVCLRTLYMTIREGVRGKGRVETPAQMLKISWRTQF